MQWGLGLEHEVHIGFKKRIEPNIHILKNLVSKDNLLQQYKNINV